jgi:hypothetical protein
LEKKIVREFTQNNEAIFCYPNPVNQATEFDIFINFPIENVRSVQIVDLTGKLVNEYVMDADADELRIVSPEKQGMYLLNLRIKPGNILYSKFIVD